MIRRKRLPLYLLALLVAFLVGPAPVAAQYYINQSALADLLTACPDDLDSLPEINYSYYVLYSSRDNNVLARNTFFKVIGDGDLEEGRKRARLVELLNRKLVSSTNIGDTLVVPDRFDVNFCAYSPFPYYYPGARDFDKLFIIEKEIQAWAAYEYGRLVRWGIVSTGGEESPTPNGRYNFNWKAEYRISSLSPPGEPWEMYWVFNFHEGRGIHIHQYAMPTGGPQSHGCVRLIDDDAKWVYNWADGWKLSSGGEGFRSGFGTVVEPGTTVLVLGKETFGHPTPFTYTPRYPVLHRVTLPAHPYDVPPGTAQQEYFDRLRGTN
ncbi:MAG: L,D-transpeptidase [Rhodothermaceae bacterium]|nr:MAG: L,D-transpeptidase [Rhodothermaceae bacterium]